MVPPAENVLPFSHFFVRVTQMDFPLSLASI